MKSKRFPVGTGGGRHPERIEAKRAEAASRNAAWRSLTPREQERALNDRLGMDFGAGRQRARLSRKAA